MLGFSMHSLSILGQTNETEGQRPIILDARVVSVEASLEGSTETASYVVEVEHVVSGFPPALLVARDTGRNSSRVPLRRYRVGERLHWVLRPLRDGTYGILSAREAQAPQGVDEDPTPGGIFEVPAESRDRRLSESLAAGSYEDQVAESVNQERWNNGQLPPVKKNNLLDTSSETHSSNMASRDFFAHCDLDTGTSPFDRMTAAGYFWIAAAENIAAGYSTPASVMAGWMSSAGHRANILSLTYREIGAGYSYDSADSAYVRRDANGDCVEDSSGGPYYHYWTQNFGLRSDVFPVVINREAYEATSHDVDLYVYGEGFAQDMRFKNENAMWSAWEPYNPHKAWTLSAGDGVKEVFAEIRNDIGAVRDASDSILLAAGCTVPDMDLDLTNQTISDTREYEACSSISAGTAFVILSPGSVTFRAPSTRLKNGFSVGSGAAFSVFNQIP